jgi:hypothetical protein
MEIRFPYYTLTVLMVKTFIFVNPEPSMVLHREEMTEKMITYSM